MTCSPNVGPCRMLAISVAFRRAVRDAQATVYRRADDPDVAGSGSPRGADPRCLSQVRDGGADVFALAPEVWRTRGRGSGAAATAGAGECSVQPAASSLWISARLRVVATTGGEGELL